MNNSRFYTVRPYVQDVERGTTIQLLVLPPYSSVDEQVEEAVSEAVKRMMQAYNVDALGVYDTLTGEHVGSFGAAGTPSEGFIYLPIGE